MPLFISLFILNWVGQWGDGTTPLLYIRKLPTLASGLYLFEKECDGFDKNILYAGCFLVSIPPLLLFVFFNKLFTSNVSLGGIKE
jgi:multiple sugar transport system permease protein